MVSPKDGRRSPWSGVFAVGDVHGCEAELRALLQKLPLARDSLVVFLGDMIDRGPSARGVVETILELQDYCHVVALLGNHELMLREFLEGTNERLVGRYIYNGGGATLASYADEEGTIAIPPAHQKFFDELAYFHVDGDYCFVHAGLPVDLASIDVARHGEEMVWMRARSERASPGEGTIVVHGHTPHHGEARIGARSINLDTACVYGGALTAMEVHSRKVWAAESTAKAVALHLRDRSDSRRQARRFSGCVPVRVESDGLVLDFETVNYSEIGLLLRPLGGVRLPAGTTVSGVIGEGNGERSFRGVVLRIDGQGHHAVKLTGAVTEPA
ncbi:MAG: metallophosphoesterase [Labilithrix sp.]|nr:metallophosphoesterase [Labilithrix sp.]